MKKIFIIIILAIMLFGFNAQAASSPHALITPNSIFYNFKIFGEWLAQKIISIGGTEAEMNYIYKRIVNRNTEILTLIDDGRIDSTAYIKAKNKQSDLREKYIVLMNNIKENERLKMAKKERENLIGDEILGNPYGDLIRQKMDETHQQILEAQKIGDNQKVSKLLENLKTLKQNYDEANVILESYRQDEKQRVERVENILSGADKVNYALDWADKYKKMIDDTSKNELYKSDQDLFAKAQKTIDNLVSGLKKIPLDNVDNKKLDDLFRGATKSLNDIARAIWQKSLNEDLAEQLPEEKTGQPAPVPFEPKKKLETIPSGNVNTEPLTLSGFGNNNLNGKVGVNFTHYFSATGGLPPYHYQLESGWGFPPQGIILDTNGKLSGTPKIAGSYTFGVSVIDTAGKHNWLTFTLNVQPVAAVVLPEPEPAPEPAIVPVDVSVTSISCDDGPGSFYLTITGTARGGAGSYVSSSGNTQCTSWTSCTRGEGQPEETSFTTSRAYNGIVSIQNTSGQCAGNQGPNCWKSIRYNLCR